MKITITSSTNYSTYKVNMELELVQNKSSNAHNFVNGLFHLLVKAGYEYKWLLEGAASLSKESEESTEHKKLDGGYKELI